MAALHAPGGLQMTKRSKKSLQMLGLGDDEKTLSSDKDLANIREAGVLVPGLLKSWPPTKFTVDKLHRLHGYKPDAEEKKSMDSLSLKSHTKGSFYQLLFNIEHCIFKAGNDTICLFSIYDDSAKMFITEEYCLNLTPNAFPTVGLIDECKVLFRDLTYEQLQKRLFIVCRIYRVGPMDAPDVIAMGKGKKVKKVKGGEPRIIRPYAVSVVRLCDHMKELLTKTNEEVHYEPSTAPILMPKIESNFTNLAFEIIEKKQGTSELAPLSIGIAYGLTLYRGDVTTVKSSYSGYDSVTHVESLDVNSQTHSDRHLLYVTVLDIHVNQRGKRAPCNVSIRVALRDNKTYQSKPCTMLGRGPMAPPSEELASPVYYHTNDPSLNQTYAVMIPEEVKELEQCHLYFTCWHVSSKNVKGEERGFSFLPLYNSQLRQLSQNKTYDLELYRHDKKSPSNYLTNPTLKPENKQIRVHYRLCSSKVLADIDVHTFVTWKHQSPEHLIQAVKRVGKKPFSELMKMLDEFMKVVFSIMSTTREQVLIEQTFFALIAVLSEVNKGPNAKYKARVKSWIAQYFDVPGVWRILARQVTQLLRWIASPEAVKAEKKDAHPDLKRQGAEIVRQLTKTMRGIQYLFQIMKRSCDKEMASQPQARKRVEAEYGQMVNDIFNLLNRLMGLSEPRAVNGVQSFAMKGFLTLFDCLPKKDGTKMAQLSVRFINAAQNSGIHNNVEKLLLIRRILEEPQISRHQLVDHFLPAMCQLLEFHVEQSIDEMIACATILTQCTPILNPSASRLVRSEIDPNTFKRVSDGKGIKIPEKLLDSFAVVLLKMFHVLDRTRKTDMTEVTNAQRIFHKNLNKNPTASDVSDDQIIIHREFLVTIVELARTITQCTGKAESFGKKSDRIDSVLTRLRRSDEGKATQIIEGVLTCAYNLLRNSLFPRPWVFMRMLEAEIGMRALSWFGSTLKRNYLGGSFHKELWNSWLQLGMTYLSNRDFALEDLDEIRSELMLKYYGDVRQVAIKKLTAAWDVLTPHRPELAETMVSAAVEASASEVIEIQNFAVNVYYQMMKSEFETTNDVKTVETHTIDQIDQLTAQYSTQEVVIGRYLDFFRKHVHAKLVESSARLRKTGEKFLNEIQQLYDYLVALRRLPSDAAHEDERTSATLKLVNYLDRIGKQELYNRYIHYLAVMHQQLNNYVEAGVCLTVHAKRLGWSKRMLREEPQVGLAGLPEWKRHVDLLELAQRQFMLGEAWEMAVRVCQELAVVYETELFDLKALSAILEKQSQTWKFIAQHDRVFHQSYLVSFRGAFEDDLRDKDYIYRSGAGKIPESVRSFTDRIKSKFGDAKVVNGSDPIKEEFLRADYQGQYIQITTLAPSSHDELDGRQFKWDSLEAPLRMKKYYREMETDVFSYTFMDKSKKKKGENEFRNLWITKVFLIAEDVTPHMRRRVPILREKRVTYTPLQTAINNLNSKTGELEKICERCEMDATHDIKDLSMNLNGILDAAVMGGISKYREAFFDGTYFAALPNEERLTVPFKDALRTQMVEAEKGLGLYSTHRPDNLAPHVTHLEGCLVKMRRDLTEFLGKTK